LIEGELSNRVRGQVTGTLRFRGLPEPVTLQLKGDFHRDIRGASIKFIGPITEAADELDADYMQGFACLQTGSVGDITAGREPRDYVDYPYIEWYSEQNGRVVLELDPEQVCIIGTPHPADGEEQNDPAESRSRFFEFMTDMARSLSNGAK
jgi:hypothetical protein